MSFLILIIGFVLLIKGADVFVEGASSIAKKFNVPSMIIGLTIVAMGTSAPEAAVSITSSLAGQNDMCVANVVGSNFFNILVVLGVSSIIAKLPVQEDTIKKDTPFLIFTSALLLAFGINLKLGRIEGLALLSLFTYFLVNTIKSANQLNKMSISEKNYRVEGKDAMYYISQAKQNITNQSDIINEEIKFYYDLETNKKTAVVTLKVADEVTDFKLYSYDFEI